MLDNRMTGAQLIAAERARQVLEEGWTPEHDAHHQRGDLALAGAAYAKAWAQYRRLAPDWWPWDMKWWKPALNIHDSIKDLVKAGALIAAEIDRYKAEARKVVEG